MAVPRPAALSLCAILGWGQGRWSRSRELVGSGPAGTGVICPVPAVQTLMDSPGAAPGKGSPPGSRQSVCSQLYPVTSTTAPRVGVPKSSPYPVSTAARWDAPELDQVVVPHPWEKLRPNDVKASAKRRRGEERPQSPPGEDALGASLTGNEASSLPGTASLSSCGPQEHPITSQPSTYPACHLSYTSSLRKSSSHLCHHPLTSTSQNGEGAKAYLGSSNHPHGQPHTCHQLAHVHLSPP